MATETKKRIVKNTIDADEDKESVDDRPMISVITPVYKNAQFIDETIQSVVGQDYKNWEMIIIDDGADEESLKRIKKMVNKEARCRFYQHSENRGAAAARNTGLEKSRGRFITFIDADDVILPDKFARQVDFMLNNNCPISYTGYRRMTSDGCKEGMYICGPSQIDYKILLKNTAMGTLTPMYDQDLVGVHIFDEDLPMHEDFVFWCRILREGHVAQLLDHDLARYRQGYVSLSSNKANSARRLWAVYRKTLKLNIFYAAWCFVHYAARGVFKRRRF